MYKSHIKNVLYLLSLDNIVSYPSIANGIKNDITSSETHIIICLLKTR